MKKQCSVLWVNVLLGLSSASFLSFAPLGHAAGKTPPTVNPPTVESMQTEGGGEVEPSTTVGDATSHCDSYGTPHLFCFTSSPRGVCSMICTSSGCVRVGDNC